MNGYSIVKYVVGGKYHSYIIPIRRGPKPELEYGYIDHVPMPEIISKLSGLQRDFNGHPEIVLLLGNHIRYKFSDQEEHVLLSSGNEMEKKENLNKIITFYHHF